MVEARTRACINTVLMFACCNLSRMSVSSRCCEVAEWERGQSSPLMVVIQTARIQHEKTKNCSQNVSFYKICCKDSKYFTIGNSLFILIL